MDPVLTLTLFVLAAFVGFEVVTKVSATLHTPLMSGANAIHGIILVGAIIVTAHSEHWLITAVGALAVVMATVNLVGGFWVTARMLRMFSAERRPAPADSPGPAADPHQPAGSNQPAGPVNPPAREGRAER